MKKIYFYETTKDWKELFLLMSIRDNSNISQIELSEVLSVSSAMVSKYINDLNRRNIINIERISHKDQIFTLNKYGISYLNNLLSLYMQNISDLKDSFEQHLKEFQKNYNLKVAITNSFGTIIPYIAEKFGIFDKNQLYVDLYEYSNGDKLMEDFERNEYDIALLGSVPAYLWKTYGIPINVIAAVDFGGHAIIVRNYINSIKEIKDKKIIIPENTTVTNNLFRIFIKSHPEYDINYENDLCIRNVPIENIQTYVNQNDVDAVILWEPHVSEFISMNSNFKLLYDFWNEDQNYISNVVVVNDKFYSIYKQTVNRFLEVLEQAVSYYEENTDEVDLHISKKLNVSIETIQSARQRTKFRIKRLI